MPTITKKEIQKLIAKNRLPQLFEVLTEINEALGGKISSHDIIVLQAKYTGLKDLERAGTVSYADKTLTESQIISSLTGMVSKLSDHPYEISEPLHLKLKEQRRSRSLIYWLLSTLLIGLIGAAIYVSNVAKPDPAIPAQSNPNTLPEAIPTTSVDTPHLTKTVVPIRIHAVQGSDHTSQMVVGTDTLPLAYMDFAFQEGREQEINRLADACYYQFDITNPSKESVTLQSLFVEVNQYKPIPTTAKTINIQPFEEATVVYLHMGKSTSAGANIYRNSFYVVDGKKKTWGKIKVNPSGSERVAVRINAKEPGIYSFQLGVEYNSAQNDSLVRKYVLPRKTTWAFKKRPE